MTMKEKKARFEAARPQQENVLLTFTGVDGYDVYNCSIPFTWEGREYIFVSAGASGADGNTIPHIQDAVTVYNRVGAAIEAKMNDNNK